MGTGRSSMVDQTAEQDDAFCGEVLAASRSSFALPIRLLPTAKRRAMTALYAFCRRADDIVDAPAPATAAGIGDEHRERRQAELASFRQGFTSAVAGGDCEDPVLRAMARVVRAYAIPTRALFAVLDGVEQDLCLSNTLGTRRVCLRASMNYTATADGSLPRWASHRSISGGSTDLPPCLLRMPVGLRFN